MADITIHNRHSKNSYGKPLLDPWDGTLDQDRNCIFCGHSINEHTAQALMVARKGRRRRTRAGLKWLACKACARDKETHQVICYQHPAEITERAHSTGYIVH